MENRPFRPCAAMLIVETTLNLKKDHVNQDVLELLQKYIVENMESFEPDFRPSIKLDDSKLTPIKAPHALNCTAAEDSPRAYFELGYATQQILCYLAYLKLFYHYTFTHEGGFIPFSSKGEPVRSEKMKPDIAYRRQITMEDLLYFEKWGEHPAKFLENNPKLESIMHYVRSAPVISGTSDFAFIMDKERLHLILKSAQDVNPSPRDMVTFGMLIYNFNTSAGMLKLLGHWNLLRESDRPQPGDFELPEEAVHIATWHGQLY